MSIIKPFLPFSGVGCSCFSLTLYMEQYATVTVFSDMVRRTTLSATAPARPVAEYTSVLSSKGKSYSEAEFSCLVTGRAPTMSDVACGRFTWKQLFNYFEF